MGAESSRNTNIHKIDNINKVCSFLLYISLTEQADGKEYSLNTACNLSRS